MSCTSAQPEEIRIRLKGIYVYLSVMKHVIQNNGCIATAVKRFGDEVEILGPWDSRFVLLLLSLEGNMLQIFQTIF